MDGLQLVVVLRTYFLLSVSNWLKRESYAPSLLIQNS